MEKRREDIREARNVLHPFIFMRSCLQQMTLNEEATGNFGVGDRVGYVVTGFGEEAEQIIWFA